MKTALGEIACGYAALCPSVSVHVRPCSSELSDRSRAGFVSPDFSARISGGSHRIAPALSSPFPLGVIPFQRPYLTGSDILTHEEETNHEP